MIAELTPFPAERSLEAKLLTLMVTTIIFGLLATTGLVLITLP